MNNDQLSLAALVALVTAKERWLFSGDVERIKARARKRYDDAGGIGMWRVYLTEGEFASMADQLGVPIVESFQEIEIDPYVTIIRDDIPF